MSSEHPDLEKNEAVAVIDKRAASAMAPAAPVGSTPSDLIRVALERGATIEQMEQLIKLQERMEATEARKAFVAAMAAFKAEGVDVITKDGVVDFTGNKGRTYYRHATLANTMRTVNPLLAKHGLSVSWVPREDPKSKEITVDCVVTHVQGHCEVTSLSGPPDGSGNKNALQQKMSTVTYLSRYTAFAALGLSSEEDDDDAGAGAKTRQQANSKDEAPAPSRESGPKGRALPDRSANAIAAFEPLGVKQCDMERAFARPALDWGADEFAQLKACWRELEELPAKDRPAKAREIFPGAEAQREREPGEEG